ncbi:MAG: carbon-phosphorus lyase complex subunit PhnI [Arhodomonas sp.]|nr:carbon-phosphorus lyase complex subunit PhnI [Arhodomonas sp.]
MKYATERAARPPSITPTAWLADQRRGDRGVPELDLAQIRQQMGRTVDRVMNEGSLADPELAALALKQAQGDINEAVFLLRAYRNTLPRLGRTEPLDTNSMRLDRRITPVFKDTPGGQMLGPTFDYTHRLLDFSRADPSDPPAAARSEWVRDEPATSITEQLVRERSTEP